MRCHRRRKGISSSVPKAMTITAAHIANFSSPVVRCQRVLEDEFFSKNAVIVCLWANYWYFHRIAATWDEATKTIKG
jgi:hypothetical protein